MVLEAVSVLYRGTNAPFFIVLLRRKEKGPKGLQGIDPNAAKRFRVAGPPRSPGPAVLNLKERKAIRLGKEHASEVKAKRALDAPSPNWKNGGSFRSVERLGTPRLFS